MIAKLCHRIPLAVILQNRHFSFVTTPIFYVNASPHIGHLYSAVIADAAHRFCKLKHPQNETVFSTGTDEHGQKVQAAAESAHVNDVKIYCDSISSKYKNLFDLADVKYTRFVRTTDPDHLRSVEHFWNALKSKDYIYLGSYSGWYCVSDEMFLSETEILNAADKNGNEIKVSKISGHTVEWSEEENFMFKLSALKSDLLHWLKDERRVEPSKFHKILTSWIHDDNAVKDISISRPSSRFSWGIPVPDCPTQTVYVWLDALVNYLTVAGYPNLRTWPPTMQVIGKDILKFHGIFWPAFLMAAGLEPPHRLFVHSHWTVNDEKMSKSKNNVVDPFEKVKSYSAVGFRYFLLKEGVPHSDGNYTETKVSNMLNADLANTFGNLLNRSVAKTVNGRQIFPKFDRQEFDSLHKESESLKNLCRKLSNFREIIDEHYDRLNFYRGIQEVMAVLYDCNKFFEDYKPWELRKTEGDQLKLECVLHVTLETLRLCSIALLPIVPEICDKIFYKLNVPERRRQWSTMIPSWENAECDNEEIKLRDERIILFQKIQK